MKKLIKLFLLIELTIYIGYSNDSIKQRYTDEIRQYQSSLMLYTLTNVDDSIINNYEYYDRSYIPSAAKSTIKSFKTDLRNVDFNQKNLNIESNNLDLSIMKFNKVVWSFNPIPKDKKNFTLDTTLNYNFVSFIIDSNNLVQVTNVTQCYKIFIDQDEISYLFDVFQNLIEKPDILPSIKNFKRVNFSNYLKMNKVNLDSTIKKIKEFKKDKYHLNYLLVHQSNRKVDSFKVFISLFYTNEKEVYHRVYIEIDQMKDIIEIKSIDTDKVKWSYE